MTPPIPADSDQRPASTAIANARRTGLVALVFGLWAQYTGARLLLELVGAPAADIPAQISTLAPIMTASALSVLAAVGTALRNRAHRYGGVVAEIAGEILP